MAETFQHPQQLRLGPLTGHSGYQASETRHVRFFLAYATNISDRFVYFAGGKLGPTFKSWSRREDLNAPSADHYSAALSLSYTGLSEPRGRTTESARSQQL